MHDEDGLRGDDELVAFGGIFRRLARRRRRGADDVLGLERLQIDAENVVRPLGVRQVDAHLLKGGDEPEPAIRIGPLA